MKSLLKSITVFLILGTSQIIFAQIKNAKTETIKISGSCGMCKSAIEKAGNVKNVAEVNWDKETQLATISYDSKKTSEDEILTRIAMAGYDSEKFSAPDDAYAKLMACCQYDRTGKPNGEKAKACSMDMANSKGESCHEGHGGNHDMKAMQGEKMPKNSNSNKAASQLTNVYDRYFLIKDALVKDNATIASQQASELLKALKTVDMAKLSTEEHSAWMNLSSKLLASTEKITTNKNIEKQREAFAKLSIDMRELVKTTKQNTPIYSAHCPMFNADWLSKEETIKNPYYGSKMLSCGSVTKTIN